MSKVTENDQKPKDEKWSKMPKNGLKQLQMTKNDLKRSRIIINDLK